MTYGLEFPECPICTEPYTPTYPDNENDASNGILIRIKVCGHDFHECCLKRWVEDERRNTCPKCRAELYRPPSRPVKELVDYGVELIEERVDEGVELIEERVDEGVEPTEELVDEGVEPTEERVDEGVVLIDERADEGEELMEDVLQDTNAMSPTYGARLGRRRRRGGTADTPGRASGRSPGPRHIDTITLGETDTAASLGSGIGPVTGPIIAQHSRNASLLLTSPTTRMQFN
jgi:hypothetical protein